MKMEFMFESKPSVYDKNWAYWQGGFNVEELNKIIAIGDSLNPERAVVFDEQNAPNARRSSVSWISLNSDTEWIYTRMCDIIQKLNNEYFGFELWGLAEHFQYTVYDSENGPEYYDWHIDSGNKGKIPRKLSVSLQLDDPHDYEGGELWIWNQGKNVVQKQQGLVAAFPSYALHKVTPVTKGIRRALVAWVTGPEFR